MPKLEKNEDVRRAVFETLSDEGFRPKWTDQGDLTFKYHGKRVFIEWYDDDDTYTLILVPNFWPIESAEELQQAFRAASQINHQCKLVKLTIVEELNVWASVDFVSSPADSVDAGLLTRRLHMVIQGVEEFCTEMSRLSSTRESKKDTDSGGHPDALFLQGTTRRQ